MKLNYEKEAAGRGQERGEVIETCHDTILYLVLPCARGREGDNLLLACVIF